MSPDELLLKIQAQVNRYQERRAANPASFNMAILMHPQTWEMLEECSYEGLVDKAHRRVFKMHVIFSHEVPVNDSYFVMAGDHPDIKANESVMPNPFAVKIMAPPQGSGGITISQNYTPSYYTSGGVAAGGGGGAGLYQQQLPSSWAFVNPTTGNAKKETQTTPEKMYLAANGWHVYYEVNTTIKQIQQTKVLVDQGIVMSKLSAHLGKEAWVDDLDVKTDTYHVVFEGGVTYVLTAEQLVALSHDLANHGMAKVHGFDTSPPEPDEDEDVFDPHGVFDKEVKKPKLDEAIAKKKAEVSAAILGTDYSNYVPPGVYTAGLSSPQLQTSNHAPLKDSAEFKAAFKEAMEESVKTWLPGDVKPW